MTHPDVTRYFMTIPEAAQLVIQAGAMGTGGDVFLLDMGESMKIVDLAKQMIRLSGFRPIDENGIGDIEIQFTGLRPGEKLYEELLIDQAKVEQTKHSRILKSYENYYNFYEISREFDECLMYCETERNYPKMKAILAQYVEGYQ